MERLQADKENSLEIQVINKENRVVYNASKRLIDILLSLLGLVIVSPIMLIVAILIKLESTGPVIFSQKRVGLNGKEFNMLKFRSMVQNAEELKEKLQKQNEMSGPMFKMKEDPGLLK